MKDYKLSATTFAGLEQILADELLQLGAKKIKKGIRNVSFEGDKGFIYKVNYNLHTALRIFKQIHHLKFVKTEKQLYKGIYDINWEKYININQTLRIDVNGKSPFFNNTQFVALKTKDAIIDQFRKKIGKRPNIDLKNPDIRILIHLQAKSLNIMLDSSGESLHKRGYRTATNIAPINEVLAAGIIKLTEWNGNKNFLDPMCGSGTFPIEAAMIAMNIPPNINRKKFGFENWKDFDPLLYEKIKKTSINKIKDLNRNIKILGYDKAPSVIKKAKSNVSNAKLDEFIQIKQLDFFKTNKFKKPTVLVFNPPYNERLSIDTQTFYKEIGDTLKNKYTDTTAWILIGNTEALKSVGLRPSKKIPLYNGKLEVRLVKYEMYSGSKKNSFTTI